MTKNNTVCPNCNGYNVRLYPNKIKGYFCKDCKMGFIHPVPPIMGKYYPYNYWVSSGLFGFIRNTVYNVCQKRRKKWILNYLSRGIILDVGAGVGKFADSLDSSFKIVSIDVPGAKIDNKNVLLFNFLKWQTKKKFDAVVYWESLEHTNFASNYLKKAHKLLKKGGLIFVEYPDFSCFEAKIFGKNWYHLDYPRHLTHTTKLGMCLAFNHSGFKTIKEASVYALEYTLPGFIASLLNFLGCRNTGYKKSSQLIFLITSVLLFFPAFFIAIIFYGLNQSPIRLIVGKKIDEKK